MSAPMKFRNFFKICTFCQNKHNIRPIHSRILTVPRRENIKGLKRLFSYPLQCVTSMKIHPDTPPVKMDELYDGHIPTSTFQKILLGVGSAGVAIVNPWRDDMIAVMGEATGELALKSLRAKMLADPVGRQILEDEPRINSQTVDLDYLKTLPDGTFGREYRRFLDKYQLTPDARRRVEFVDDVELAYVMQRYREIHDLFHTLFGMPTNWLGEVSVKTIEGLQLGLPMCVLGAVAGPVRFYNKPKDKDDDKELANALFMVVLIIGTCGLPVDNNADSADDVLAQLLKQRELSKEEKLEVLKQRKLSDEEKEELLKLLYDLKEGPSKELLSLIKEYNLEGLLEGTDSNVNETPEKHVSNHKAHTKHTKKKKKTSANEASNKVLDEALVMKSLEHMAALTAWCAGLKELGPKIDVTEEALKNRVLAGYIEGAVEIVSRNLEMIGDNEGSAEGSAENDGSDRIDDDKDMDMSKISEKISNKMREICTSLNSLEAIGAKIEAGVAKKKMGDGLNVQTRTHENQIEAGVAETKLVDGLEVKTRNRSPISRSFKEDQGAGSLQKTGEMAHLARDVGYEIELNKLIEELSDSARPIEEHKKNTLEKKDNIEERIEELILNRLANSRKQ